MKRQYKILIGIILLLAAVSGGFALSGNLIHHRIRILYSLDQKQNDQAIIDLIDRAQDYVYFAIYTFTKDNIAEALIRAKQRGLEVRGIADRGQSAEDFQQPIIQKLIAAGISVQTKTHPDGIMHIKAVVTDQGYAAGSYNWTSSATTVNDEILEVGTDKYLRDQYLRVIRQVLAANEGGSAVVSGEQVVTDGGLKTYSYTEASSHIGETALIEGKVVEVFTSSSNTTFFDYCSNYKSCPFSAVIFSSAKNKFGDLKQYQGRVITIKGKLQSYQGRAEIVLTTPDQIVK